MTAVLILPLLQNTFAMVNTSETVCRQYEGDGRTGVTGVGRELGRNSLNPHGITLSTYQG